MKNLSQLPILLIMLALFCGCTDKVNFHFDTNTQVMDTVNTKRQIAAMLDSLNWAAANTVYEKYFNYFTDDAVFLGTDATEHWTKDSFMVWAKPFFDRKKSMDLSRSRTLYLFWQT